MRIVILETAEEVSERAAEIIAARVRSHPSILLGLATGSTPLGTYAALVRMAQSNELDFSQVLTFNLDEYVGLPPDHPQSYHHYMKQHLFEPAGFTLANCHLPDGMASDLEAECARYEDVLDEAGGVDVQLLGLGSDGHIAFNEPGSSLASRTRIKALTARTRQDNSRFFESIDAVPRLSITMGIGTIMDAGEILVLATGERKAAAVAGCAEGPITAQLPASALQMHPRVTLIVDQAAASQLSRSDYYREVEDVQRQLESEQ